MKYNIQLFGADCPPFYSIQTIMDKVDEIAKVDLQINELFIVREKLVTDLKEAIKEENITKGKN